MSYARIASNAAGGCGDEGAARAFVLAYDAPRDAASCEEMRTWLQEHRRTSGRHRRPSPPHARSAPPARLWSMVRRQPATPPRPPAARRAAQSGDDRRRA